MHLHYIVATFLINAVTQPNAMRDQSKVPSATDAAETARDRKWGGGGHTSLSLQESKAISVTGSGSLKCGEMLRVSCCLDNRLSDGGEFVSFAHRPRSTPKKLFFIPVSGTHFC
jgi:hypothetical protein